MSLRWTAYVVPKPPQGGSKMQIDHFSYKSVLLSKKVCYKISLCENFQQQNCKAFTGLSSRAQMVGGDAPFYVKFFTKVTHPLRKRRFLVYSLVPSAIKPIFILARMWEHAIANGGYQSVRPSICLSHSWSTLKRFNTLKYLLHRTIEQC